MDPDRDSPSDEDEDKLDPRIQSELDKLNYSCAEINSLENELDEARVQYRLMFSEASQKMTSIAKNRKRSIQKARGYFDLKEKSKVAQGETLRAARQYQVAIGVLRAAKETIAVAEDKLLQKLEQIGPVTQLSSAWQEMLNHATIRVMEAEKEKVRCEKEHMARTSTYGDLEHAIQLLEKKFKRAIARARPYFELKSQLDLKLQQQKQNVDDLQNAIRASKQSYSESLRHLEKISEQIHESRRTKLLLQYPRQPGVGAECASASSSLSELTLDNPDLCDGSAGDTDDVDETDGDLDDDTFTDSNPDMNGEVRFRICSDSIDSNNGIDIKENGTADIECSENSTDLEYCGSTTSTGMLFSQSIAKGEVESCSESLIKSVPVLATSTDASIKANPVLLSDVSPDLGERAETPGHCDNVAEMDFKNGDVISSNQLSVTL